MQEFEKSISFDGRDIRLKVGMLAPQAGGAVLIQSGDTAVLVAATRAKGREGIDFLPLLVDYEERMYAAGRIPGGFLRREGRPPERATLTSRLIDRPLRPLFPSWLRDDIQVVATTIQRAWFQQVALVPEGRQCQNRRSGVTAGIGDQPCLCDPVLVDLRQSISGLGQQVRRGMLGLVELLVDDGVL